MSRAKDVGGLVVALAIAAGCARLGVWQVSRLHERRAFNALIVARGRLPPLALTGREPLDSVSWRRVLAAGAYDYTRERVWTGRTFEGVPAVGIVTPLTLPGGAVVWVDRGWVPSPDAMHVDTARFREGDSARVAGVAVAHAGLPFLILDSLPPPRTAGAIYRWPPLELSEGPHLSYAIQWFSFAAIILGGSLILFLKRGPGRGTHGETSI